MDKKLYDLDITKHNGHGIPTIVSAYGKQLFDIQDSYINIVIPFNKEVLESRGIINGMISGTISGAINGTLSGQEEVVVQAVIVNGRKTLNDYSKETGISRRTMFGIFETLQEIGIVQKVGSRKNGYWRVIK